MKILGRKKAQNGAACRTIPWRGKDAWVFDSIYSSWKSNLRHVAGISVGKPAKSARCQANKRLWDGSGRVGRRQAKGITLFALSPVWKFTHVYSEIASLQTVTQNLKDHLNMGRKEYTAERDICSFLLLLFLSWPRKEVWNLKEKRKEWESRTYHLPHVSY